MKDHCPDHSYSLPLPPKKSGKMYILDDIGTLTSTQYWRPDKMIILNASRYLDEKSLKQISKLQKNK